MTSYTPTYGIPYPDGDDPVVVHSDVERLALQSDTAIRGISQTVEGLRWRRGAINSGTLDSIPEGEHNVTSGVASEAFGLPTGLSGVLEKWNLDANGLTGMMRWTPRVSPSQVWVISRNTDGWTYWTQIGGGAVSPEEFGAVGDGQTDDTAALRNWLNYLANSGVDGSLPYATYRITDTLALVNPSRPFRIRGAGTNSSRILIDNPEPKTVISIRGARYLYMSDFYVGGASTDRPAGHGISMSDAVGSMVERVRVGVYWSTAILFFQYTAGQVCENNRIKDCFAHGSGIARNGFLLETCRKSYITNCTVMSLSFDETPSYGLQLKNDCIDCQIEGGIVNSALAGVAFGADSQTRGHRNHVIGVTTVACKWGFIASHTQDSYVQMLINHTAAPEGGTPARIGARCSGMQLDLTLRNVPDGVSGVHVGSSGNSLRITPMMPVASPLVTFVPLLQDTTVIYEGKASDLVIDDQAQDPSNNAIALIQDT